MPDGTPVVLVSVDTLRSDRLPAYGYIGVSTPAIDRLRDDSILFRNAYSPIPLTLPSHSSVLTGLLPPHHGVRDNMGYRLETDGLPYLPSTLRKLGYKTGAAVSSFVLRGASGLSEGFDFYDDQIILADPSELGTAQRSGDVTLARALQWLRSVSDQPFFLFFHLYEPHTPWEPQEPFASRYASPYDGEVATMDRIVGELLAELDRLGRYDDSIIIFFSDHGEGLDDHGYPEHGPLLYREALQVPLFLKLPGSRWGGETVEHPAQLIDIVPTLLSLLRIDSKTELPGTSLLKLREPGTEARVVYGETLYPRIHFGWSDLASLIEYPYHLIQGPDPELYDLEQDPDELVNILPRQQRIAARLQRQLDGFDRRWQPPSAEDPATRRQLEALGYLGGSAVETEGPLADPKTRLHVLPLMSRAIKESGAGDYARAEATLQKLVAEEPGMVDAWEKLGFALLELDREEEAVAAFEEAVRRSGGAPQVALSAASGFLRAGRLDEAEAHASLALEVHELARDLLAQVALRKGELERAEQLVNEAIAQRGTRLGPLITLANLRLDQERIEEAIEVTRQIELEFGERTDRQKLSGLYFIRGKAQALLGESSLAEEAFLQEIELSPSSLPPYTHLAFLYALEGRAKDVGSTLRRMVESNPRPAAYADAVRTLRAMGDPQSAAALLQDARQRWPESAELRQPAV